MPYLTRSRPAAAVFPDADADLALNSALDADLKSIPALPSPVSFRALEAAAASPRCSFTGTDARGQAQTFTDFCQSPDFSRAQAQLLHAWAELSDYVSPTGRGDRRLAERRRDLIDPPPLRTDPPERGYLFGFGKRWLDDLLIAVRHPSLNAQARGRCFEGLMAELNAGREASACFARALTRLRCQSQDPLERQADALRTERQVQAIYQFMNRLHADEPELPKVRLRHAVASADQMLHLLGLILQSGEPARRWPFDASPEVVNRCEAAVRAASSSAALASEWTRRLVDEVRDDLAQRPDGPAPDDFNALRPKDLQALGAVLAGRPRFQPISVRELIASRTPQGGGHLLRAPHALTLRLLDRITDRGLAVCESPTRLGCWGDGQQRWSLHQVADRIVFVQDDRTPGRLVRHPVHLDDLDALDRGPGLEPTPAFAASLSPALRRLLAETAQQNDPPDSQRRPAAWWTSD